MKVFCNGANPLPIQFSETKKPLSQTPMETHLFEVTPQMGSESDLTAFTCLGFHTRRANYKHNFLCAAIPWRKVLGSNQRAPLGTTG